MKTVVSSLFLICLCILESVLAQSIADTVRRDHEQRTKANPKGKSFTEEDLKTIPSRSSITTNDSKSARPEMGNKRRVSGSSLIPIERQSNSMIVNVELNNRAHTKLIVDTGASITSISSNIAEILGIKINERSMIIPTQTANGPALVPMIKLRSLRVGEVELNDIDVLVMSNWPNPEVTGLLGMNFFSNFDWSTDTANNQLILRPIALQAASDSYGGYGKEWWMSRFRFLSGSLDHLKEELKRAEVSNQGRNISQIKSSIEYLEKQLDELNRQANQLGVPREFRR